METLFAGEVRSPAAVSPSGPAGDYLRAMNDAHAELTNRLALAAQLLEDDDGSFSSAAATHRRLIRQFLDGQRALLRQRAGAVAAAHDVAADARAAAEAIVSEAYQLAGLERVPPRVVEVPEAGDGRSDSFPEALAELQQLLDDWWRSELATSSELLERATETADLIRSLARIEAGEVLAAADVPSPLPAPTAGFMDRSLLPPDVDDAMSAAETTDLLDVCDSLLRVLHDGADVAAPGRDDRAGIWAPPVPSPIWAPPSVGFAPPQVSTTADGSVALATGGAASPGPSGDDAFGRFWGEGPEAHRGRTRSIVLQAAVSMLAFTGVLTVIMVLIG